DRVPRLPRHRLRHHADAVPQRKVHAPPPLRQPRSHRHGREGRRRPRCRLHHPDAGATLPWSAPPLRRPPR
ncbi:hypothetical protein BN1708_019361, partial [Verticillium longisporum]